QTMPSTIRKGASGTRIPSSISFPLPWRVFSAQALDLGGQARVAGDVVGFDFGQAAVDVAHPGADLAGGALRALPHALPVLLLLPVDVEMRRLLVQQQAGDEVERDGAAARQERQPDEAEPDPERVDPGVVRDPGADAHQLGVLLVPVERGARAVHWWAPFFSASRRSSSRSFSLSTSRS